MANDDAATTDGKTSVTIDVLANDSDPDGDPITVVAVTDPPYGSAVIDARGSTITYTPTLGPGGSGTFLFTYTISDGQGGTGTATVTVTVTVP